MAEDYQTFLDWLSPDRAEADRTFLNVRAGLIRYFTAKGCSDPDMLSDETINRVVIRLGESDPLEIRNKLNFIFRFAKNLNYEYLRTLRSTRPLPNDNLLGTQDVVVSEEETHRFECLDRCISTLKTGEGEMVLEYFGFEGKTRSEARRMMAKRLEISYGNLHVRVYRAKADLRRCVNRCLEKML